MATTLNADTQAAGAVLTGDNTGILQLQSNGVVAVTVSANLQTSFANTTSFVGAATFDSTLSVTGATTFTGDATFSNELKATSYNESYNAVTSSSNATEIDCETGNMFSHTLTENTTFTFSNPPASGTGYMMTVELVQDSTARTVTWPTSVDWPAATAPTISTDSGAVDMFVFTTRDGGTTWYGFTVGQAIA